MSKYSIEVNNSFTFNIEQKDKQLFNEDTPLDIDMVEIKDGRFHVIYQNQSYNADVLSHNAAEKTFTIRINNNEYTLQLKNQFDLLLDKLGLANLAANKVSDILAPMPGLVLDIKVRPGQCLKKGDPVLILEAMKMENVLKAPGEGIVKQIMVKQADAVEKNQIMVVME